MKSHQKTHTKVKAFECDICHKTFRRSFTLKQHKLIHERENKPAQEKIELKSEIKNELDSSPFIPNQQTPSEEVEIDVCGDLSAITAGSGCGSGCGCSHGSGHGSCGHSTGSGCGCGSGMSPQHSSSTGDSLDLSVDSDQDQSLSQSQSDRKQNSNSPHSNSDSGHGSPNAKLEASSEEEATNSGSDDSGAIVQEKPRFYRPFEDAEKPQNVQNWAGPKRNRDEIPIDITQTKRVRDNNGKIVVYPGIRDNNTRMNPTR